MLGDSGTSFKTSPAIGRCLAEWIVEGRTRTADLTPFRSTRFAEGKPWVVEDNYVRERLALSRRVLGGGFAPFRRSSNTPRRALDPPRFVVRLLGHLRAG